MCLCMQGSTSVRSCADRAAACAWRPCAAPSAPQVVARQVQQQQLPERAQRATDVACQLRAARGRRPQVKGHDPAQGGKRVQHARMCCCMRMHSHQCCAAARPRRGRSHARAWSAHGQRLPAPHLESGPGCGPPLQSTPAPARTAPQLHATPGHGVRHGSVAASQPPRAPPPGARPALNASSAALSAGSVGGGCGGCAATGRSGSASATAASSASAACTTWRGGRAIGAMRSYSACWICAQPALTRCARAHWPYGPVGRARGTTRSPALAQSQRGSAVASTAKRAARARGRSPGSGTGRQGLVSGNPLA